MMDVEEKKRERKMCSSNLSLNFPKAKIFQVEITTATWRLVHFCLFLMNVSFLNCEEKFIFPSQLR